MSNIAFSSPVSEISTMRSTPPRADHDRHADIHVLDAVLAVEVGGAGQHALLVLEVALGHGDGRGGRRIEGRAGLQQVDDLAAALAGALDDGVELAPGSSSPS